MAEQEFPATVTAPAHARQFAAEALDGLLGRTVPAGLLDDVQLVVSELVTNAVRAGSPAVRLAISLAEEGRLTIRVTDAADGWPRPRDAATEDPGGRGLALVSAIAASWGADTDGTGTTTKTVWAELAVPV